MIPGTSSGWEKRLFVPPIIGWKKIPANLSSSFSTFTICTLRTTFLLRYASDSQAQAMRPNWLTWTRCWEASGVLSPNSGFWRKRWSSLPPITAKASATTAKARTDISFTKAPSGCHSLFTGLRGQKGLQLEWMSLPACSRWLRPFCNLLISRGRQNFKDEVYWDGPLKDRLAGLKRFTVRVFMPEIISAAAPYKACGWAATNTSRRPGLNSMIWPKTQAKRKISIRLRSRWRFLCESGCRLCAVGFG